MRAGGTYEGAGLWEPYEGWARHKMHKFKKRSVTPNMLRFLNLCILFKGRKSCKKA